MGNQIKIGQYRKRILPRYGDKFYIYRIVQQVTLDTFRVTVFLDDKKKLDLNDRTESILVDQILTAVEAILYT
jgi:hypothetical protein